ncbi:hypothetical protein CDL12_16520 [Handroanthus impetiginosus]|uniref:VQ domain-containing protein n=1 Tax=Handroanthus impetiginosus TaxID=429701 RepID=A0A2G9H018_9LAMI|nr:hypothetical protein CDL12_16520 [Handroanthus impetiginosus]
MHMPEFPSGRSPRREHQLHGPRPSQLRVSKDSHKIRKPALEPPPAAPPQTHHHPHGPPRPPVIIYTVSPKIIHVNPNEFMSLVQRLTGPNTSCASSTVNNSAPTSFQENGGSISPAARLASIEKTKSYPRIQTEVFDQSMEIIEGLEIGSEIERTGQFPGVLSPNPNNLPPLIPPNFFSAPSDSNPLNFFPDLSPVLNCNRNFNQLENGFVIHSPNTLDLFNTLFDL